MRNRPEHDLQVRLFHWITLAKIHGFNKANEIENGAKIPLPPKKHAIPELKWIFAIPNGATFSRTKSIGQRRGKFANDEGRKSGVSDICWPWNNGTECGLFIEIKNGKKGKLSDNQKEFIEFVTLQNYCATIARSFDEARAIIEQHYYGCNIPE